MGRKILNKYRTHGHTFVMGILNVTPDSFYDGGKYFSIENAIGHGEKIVKQGADIIDIGGESTRPGSEPVSESEEIKRVIPVIEKLSKKVSVPISIDTQKSKVARAALDAGASIVNDISAFRNDPLMCEVVKEYDVSVILMHMKGTPKDMQEKPEYEDVISEIKEFFKERIEFARKKGIKEENIVLDPGIGFGKSLEHNIRIIKELAQFKDFGMPILIGPSRKSFIGKILGCMDEDRIWGTAASVAISVLNGADIVRVHDVSEMKQVVKIAETMKM
jgi:dihydropteroate synthase